MDATIADIVIFCAGAVTGGLIVGAIGLRLIGMAVEKIVRKMISQGYFFYEGRLYYVDPKLRGHYDG